MLKRAGTSLQPFDSGRTNKLLSAEQLAPPSSDSSTSSPNVVIEIRAPGFILALASRSYLMQAGRVTGRYAAAFAEVLA
jgi:hypothetical protein